MRKMAGSGNYLKNQVRKNLAKAALCLFLFFFTLFIVGSIILFGLISFPLDLTGLLVSLVPLAAFYYYLHRYRVYNAGWVGEKQVDKLLSSSLNDDYLLLNGLHLRTGGGDIDHIILGPTGVYVLETKNWSGVITCRGDEWERADKPDFTGSPSLQVKRNAARIERIIDASPPLRALGISVEAIVVFTNKRAGLHLNNPTVLILRLPQLAHHIIASIGSDGYSQERLEAIAKEILKQKG